ncbi:MAG: PhzF family phenazine biosynthesis protein [Rhodospirillales bacterium]|nr:PhzF family phenazine biosynthesis protein [Rhodospirillales bacterium]
MTTRPVYQIDAFSERIFGGNPAAVCPLDGWLSDAVMQQLAAENNLSETAFFVQTGDASYELRWFTPAAEVDLCGHATLATAHLIFEILNKGLDALSFQTKSGVLQVARKGDMIELDFPARPAVPAQLPDGFQAAHGCSPAHFLRAAKNLAVFEAEADVAAFRPDLAYIKSLAGDGLIITAPGTSCDFVSRYFAPHQGIDEDPVTGSAHCTSVPYWAGRLGKTALHARQISKRGGDLHCQLDGDRVKMAGRAVLYLEGKYHLP